MKEFELSKYTLQAEKLLTKTKDIFQEMKISLEDLPKTMQPDEGTIKLVFVGQYSAGKSSIIKMLSGINTDIGAAITTQNSKAYDWNGLQIIDTPGIQTGLRPDHDEITYNEIGQAALLVFVVTSEGFDRQIGEHFRKLAIEQKRGSNMVLVVNKMDRTMLGNTPEQQEIIRNDMRKVITPFKPEDLYLTFISTQDYEEYLEEDDAEIKEELLQESGHDVFIDNLNAFVAKKQVSARIQRPLYTLEKGLRKAMGISVDEEAIDGAEELIKRKLRIFNNARDDYSQDIERIVQNCKDDIIYDGHEASLCVRIEKGVSDEDIKAELNKYAFKVSDIVKACEQEVQKSFSMMIDRINKDLNDEMSSDFAKNIAIRLEKLEYPTVSTDDGEDNSSDLAVSIAKKVGNTILEKGVEGSKLAGNVHGGNIMSGIDLASANLTKLSGSLIHGAVKGVGSFFGIKFAPWEALKWTKGIAVLGAALTVISALYTIYNLVMSQDKQEETERKIKDARNGVRDKFNEWADQVYDEFMRLTEEQMVKWIDPKIEESEKELETFQKRRELLKTRKEKLNGIFEEEQQLMKLIENDLQ